MKNRCGILKMLIIFLICVSLLSGCALNKETSMEKEEVYAIDLQGDGDVMPIFGFYGPYFTYINRDGNTLPDYFEEKYFEMMADVGLNLIAYSNASYSAGPDLVMTALDLCDKYGMGYIVYDPKVVDIDASVLESRIARYSSHPAFRGVYLVDEVTSQDWPPNGSEKRAFSKFEEVAESLQDLDIFYYMSLNAIWSMNQGDTREKYEKYVAEYCETIKPQYLLIADYPFYPYKNSLTIDEYFYNMCVLRKYAEEYNIPFWMYVGAGSQWNDERKVFDSNGYYPSEGQFNWNVNTILAFGAKGIGYFPIIQPEHFAWAESTEWDSYRNGLIGVLGNKTMWYNFAQNMNKHIAVIDEVLMNSSHKGVIISGEQAVRDTKFVDCLIESGEFQELKSVNGDAMVGCFNYQGKTALYVVNHSMENAQYITLNFNKTHEVRMIQNAEESQVKAKSVKLDMAAGEGVLLVIE